MTHSQDAIIHDFTRGSLLRHLLLFSLPFMASNAMQVLYSLVDMAVVGHFVGKGGLAAVGLASQLFTFMTMVCLGLSQGGQVIISQLIGSGRREMIGPAIGTMFTFLLSLGAVVTLLGLLFSRQFLGWLNTPPEIIDDALAYMHVCSAGVIFAFGYNIVSAVMRGLGDSRHPFIFILIASLINVVLDLLFIAVFHWGVFGAGLATILGQAFSFLYALRFLHAHRAETGFTLSPDTFRPRRDLLKLLLKLGIPLAGRFSIVNFSMLFVFGMVATFGQTALGTFGAGIRLDDIANKMSLGVMMAFTGVTAQNFGAGHFDRIRRAFAYTLLISSVFYLIYASCLWFFPEQLFRLFSNDPDILSICHVFVHAIIWTFPGLLLLKGTNGFVHGIGNTFLGMIFGILDGCVLRIGLSWLLGAILGLGFYGYVLGYGLAPLGSAIPGLLYFLFAPWEKRKPAIPAA